MVAGLKPQYEKTTTIIFPIFSLTRIINRFICKVVEYLIKKLGYMVNVTEYLRTNGSYERDSIKNFLRATRVKYFISSNNCIVKKTHGRYGETLFSEDLFSLFVNWKTKYPISLLNRKEYEINEYIQEYFTDVLIQYKVEKYIFDWYIPSLNLLIEFNEKEHNTISIKCKDNIKISVAELLNYSIFIISEKTALIDLARLSKLYK